jgi:HD superfamily phosphohydrolase
MTRFIGRLRQIDGDLPLSQRVTPEQATIAVAAAFLHDLGHGPLSHLFEEALPDGPSHEAWTVRLVLDPASAVHHILAEHDPELPSRVAEMIGGRHALAFLSSTVSGTFDVDRCDYLLRDAHFTGVSYGTFDLDWLVRSLRFGHVEEPGCAPHLAIDGVKGLPAIESFVLARLFMFQQVYFHKASRASEWHFSRILARIRRLLLDGSRVEPMPPGIESLLRDGDATLGDYLALDDNVLWNALSNWRTSSDAILRDLCQRLYSRKLFKTLELFGEERTPSKYRELLELACDRARALGLDPEYYVGLDEAVDVPFDNAKEPLKVIFPDNVAHAPRDVSFILGRLSGETLTRTRLVFPRELRDQVLAHLGKPPLS